MNDRDQPKAGKRVTLHSPTISYKHLRKKLLGSNNSTETPWTTSLDATGAMHAQEGAELHICKTQNTFYKV